MNNEQRNVLLKLLPSVDKIVKIMSKNDLVSRIPRSILISCIRSSINYFRSKVLKFTNPFSSDDVSIIKCIIEDVISKINDKNSSKLRRVVNATGVVIHTNLGRSLLPNKVIKNLISISEHYSNLEFNLYKGSRGERYSSVESILCEITNAESAFVVNNNAGAVLICLDTIAHSKEVVISRGELVEIGGSFRIPDVMKKSGSIIKEIGTTNRTHIQDYTNAITENTGLIMKVHTSNYCIVGFTASVSLSELVSLGKCKSLPVFEDLGSGTFIDLSKYGLLKEPTIQESIASGVDVVTFSGDKLLGGPQAGIILGKENYIKKIKKNPLARALRIDKMTLAVLEATLRLYYDEKKAIKNIPTLKMLLQPVSDIEKRAIFLRDKIGMLVKRCNDIKVNLRIFDVESCAGGGAVPLAKFPSKCLGIMINNLSANKLETHMRNNSTPIIGRIENNCYILDMRTVSHDDLNIIEHAFENLLTNLE